MRLARIVGRSGRPDAANPNAAHSSGAWHDCHAAQAQMSAERGEIIVQLAFGRYASLAQNLLAEFRQDGKPGPACDDWRRCVKASSKSHAPLGRMVAE